MNSVWHWAGASACVLGVAGLALGGCGAPDSPAEPVRHSLVAPKDIKNPEPTLENIEQWQSLWDKKTWLVGWKEPIESSSGLSLTDIQDDLRQRIHSQIVEAFLAQPGLSLADSERDKMGEMLSAQMQTEVIRIPVFKKQPGGAQVSLALSPEESEVSDIVRVSFPESSEFWQELRKKQMGLMLNATDDQARAVAALQQKTLSTLPQAAWAEPNLMSTFSEYEYAPESKSGAKMWQTIQRVRADAGYFEAKDVAGNHQYEYGKSNSLNTTFVGVIDTGVDYIHPDLKDSMLKNPRDKADCQDNDGNGYIDDIYGIDATIEPTEWNKKIKAVCGKEGPEGQPNPGPADALGAGHKCPPTPTEPGAQECGHGSHVAGIIAAQPGKDTSTIGVCPTCKITSLRVASLGHSKSTGQDYDRGIEDVSQVRALNYVLRFSDESGSPYLRIVNMSLGKYFTSRSVRLLVRKLIEMDILVVAAAGNDDTDTPNYPAAYEPVLAVCSTGLLAGPGANSFAKSSFSNFGYWVDVCAPGAEILSTVPCDNTGGQCSEASKDMSGTSMATPVVAGAAGFLKSISPTLSSQGIIERIKKYANAPGLYNPDSNINRLYYGWLPGEAKTQYYLLGTGMLDLGAAVSEGKSCWDSKSASSCISYVYQNKNLGLQSQVTSGCVMGSIAGRADGLLNITTSLPFVWAQVWLGLRFVRRWFGVRRKKA